MSERSERAREKAYDSRKDAEESVEIWKGIRQKVFLSDPVPCLEREELLLCAIITIGRRNQKAGTLPTKEYPASPLIESEEAGHPLGLAGKEGHLFSSLARYSKIASTTR